MTTDDTTSTTPPAPAPTLSRAVWYVDRQIPGSTRTATVVGTRESIAHDEGVPLPATDMHAHLLVMPPQGAAYNAIDVPYDPDGAPGTWHWPTRVTAW